MRNPVFLVPGRDSHCCMVISWDKRPPAAIGYLCCPNKAWCSMAAANKSFIWDFGPESKSDMCKCKECDFLFMLERRVKPSGPNGRGRANNRNNNTGNGKRTGSNSGKRASSGASAGEEPHVHPTPKRKASTPKPAPSVDEILNKLQELTLAGMSFDDAASQLKNPLANSTTIVEPVEPNADQLKKLENEINSFQKRIISGINYTDALNKKLAEGYKKLGELKTQQDLAKASYEKMCAELATKSQSTTLVPTDAEGSEVIAWPTDFSTMSKGAKQRVLDQQMDRINKLQTFLDTADDASSPLEMEEDGEDNGTEVSEIGDQDPNTRGPPPGDHESLVVEEFDRGPFDRAPSSIGRNRVSPYPNTPNTPGQEDDEQNLDLDLVQQLALGSELFGPNGSHRPAGSGPPEQAGPDQATPATTGGQSG